MFWITFLAKCQRQHKDYYWKGSHCSQASTSSFRQEDHWKLSRFAGKNRSAKCIVHRLQFEILQGSSLTCSAPLETYLDRIGSRFWSSSAQHWLPREAHFSVYQNQKSHLQCSVCVKCEQDCTEAAWGPERSGWSTGRKVTVAIATVVQQFEVLLNYLLKNPHISRGNIFLQHNPALEHEKAVSFRTLPEQLRLGGGFWAWWPLIYRALLSQTVTKLLAVIGSVATELGTLLWSCMLGYVLKMLPSNG